MVTDIWVAGDAYEAYMGRWSRLASEAFLGWLDLPSGKRWLDVGCGTGALTATILKMTDPAEIMGVDPADGFLATARAHITDPRATFRTGQAQQLPVPDTHFDAVVSGLTLNFVPDPGQAAAEFSRAAVAGGTVAAYVWDYADGMSIMRHFWDAAAALDPAAAELDEGRRFPLCQPQALHTLWTDAGLDNIAVQAINIPTRFTNFDDYWLPFLGGQGQAPAYAMSLTEHQRGVLRDLLRVRLASGPDGPIPLTARAWAVSGVATGR